MISPVWMVLLLQKSSTKKPSTILASWRTQVDFTSATEELTPKLLSPQQCWSFWKVKKMIKWSGWAGVKNCKEQDEGEWDKPTPVIWSPTFLRDLMWTTLKKSRTWVTECRRSRAQVYTLNFPLAYQKSSPFPQLTVSWDTHIFTGEAGHHWLPSGLELQRLNFGKCSQEVTTSLLPQSPHS